MATFAEAGIKMEDGYYTFGDEPARGAQVHPGSRGAHERIIALFFFLVALPLLRWWVHVQHFFRSDGSFNCCEVDK
jgi:hypothetical protein